MFTILHNIFLNSDISLNISNTALKFEMYNLCNVLEGSVSQIFHLGPRLFLIKCRKKFMKKSSKVACFLT